VGNEGPILSVASAVAGGSAVDWESAERLTLDERDRAVLHALKLVSEIADVAARDPFAIDAPPVVDAPQMPSTWGHLRIIDQLGCGAFGTVFRAWDSTLERDVALKLIRVTSGDGVLDVSRARPEAQRLARVHHANVVTIHGADVHDGYFGIWMELIRGCTLSELLLGQGTLSAREAAAIGIDLCHALAAVHGADLLHGDIKASNVMRQDGGRIVLMDLGAGRPIPRPDERAQRLAGTPIYLAPEVLSGYNVSVSCDIYSLGVLLYQLVSGKFPVEGNSHAELKMAHSERRYLPLRDARPDLPTAFVNVIDRALSPDPRDRFKSAGQFGAALAEVSGTQYRPDPLPMPWWKLVAAATATAAVLVGGLQVGRTFLRESNPVVEADRRQPAIVPPATNGAVAPAYQVSAVFYADRADGSVKLSGGSSLALKDQLFLAMDVSRPAFVYVINRDDKNEWNLLFPLPGFEPQNPVPVGKIRLPGSWHSEEKDWVVTSSGEREHFFVYVSPERVMAIEDIIATLPRAEFDRPVTARPLPDTAVLKLRGVGGLAPAGKPSTGGPILPDMPTLPDGAQTWTGTWARQIAFANPVK